MVCFSCLGSAALLVTFAALYLPILAQENGIAYDLGNLQRPPSVLTHLGPLATDWTPPPECHTATYDKAQITTWSRATLSGEPRTITLQTQSTYRYGCWEGNLDCCPPGWKKDGYYAPGPEDPGEHFLWTVPSRVHVIVGDRTAYIACPTLAQSSSMSLGDRGPRFVRGTTYTTGSFDRTSQLGEIYCEHMSSRLDGAAPTYRETYRLGWARPIVFFRESVEGGITEILSTTPAESSTQSTIDNSSQVIGSSSDMVSQDNPSPKPTSDPSMPPMIDTTSTSNPLSTGAIAGIGVGVTALILAFVILFLVLRFRRKRQSLDDLPKPEPPPSNESLPPVHSPLTLPPMQEHLALGMQEHAIGPVQEHYVPIQPENASLVAATGQEHTPMPRDLPERWAEDYNQKFRSRP